MDLKKSYRASLENKRTTNFFIGLIVSCSLILISFEWTRPLDHDPHMALANNMAIDIEIMEAIPREAPEPPPKEELPAIKEILDIVPDDVMLEEQIFDWEVTKDTEYDFVNVFTDETEKIVEPPVPFAVVEDKPLFNGGDPRVEFTRYISKHLIYPESAAKNGVDGRVTLQFVIDENGFLIDAEVIGSVHKALDAEALRVVRSSPRWTPGKQRSKPVKVSYTFPINFKLQ
jgi:protein TonB